VTPTIDMLDKGYLPANSPDVAALRTELDALGMGEELVKLDRATLGANFGQSLARQPPTVSAGILDQLRRKVKTTEDAQLYDATASNYATSEREWQNNPLEHGARLLDKPLPPLQLGSPEAFGASIDSRAELIDQIEAMRGERVTPLQSDEADAFVYLLDNLPVSDQIAYLDELQARFPEDSTAIYEQIDKRAAPVLSIAAQINAEPGGGSVTQEILHGQELIKNQPNLRPPAAKVNETVYSTLGDLYSGPGFEEHRAKITAAATALYVKRQGFDPVYDDKVMEKALKDVTGGIIDYNPGGWTKWGAGNSKVEAPYRGADPRVFEEWISHLSTADIKAAGGFATGDIEGPTPKEQLDSFKLWAKPVSIGHGEYAFTVGGNFVLRKDGGDKRNGLLFVLTWPEVGPPPAALRGADFLPSGPALRRKNRLPGP